MEAPIGTVQLIITFDPANRAVQVTGPIADKPACYAMLEMAKDAIRDYKPSPIQAPPLNFRMPPPS
jgi:hypothetical protein